MFEAYRAWLESELRLLGNASHHAYSFGQANMAKRALERFDEALRDGTDAGSAPVLVTLGADEARLAIDALASHGGAEPALVVLRSRLNEAIARREDARAEPASSAFATPLDPEAMGER